MSESKAPTETAAKPATAKAVKTTKAVTVKAKPVIVKAVKPTKSVVTAVAKVEAMDPLMELMMGAKLGIQARVAATDELLKKNVFHNTGIPAMNIALSGDVYGGITPGCTVIAGPSKHFKTLFGLAAVATWQRAHPMGIVILYNNEFGLNEQYMIKSKINMSRVLHCPFATLEELRADMWNRLQTLPVGAEVYFLTDSIGAGATEQELKKAGNAEAQNDDRARAKVIKSLFRFVGPALNIRGITAIFIAHTRKEGDAGFEKTIVAGGQGPYYFADNILVISRRPLKTKVKGDKADADVKAMYNSNDSEFSITEGYRFLMHIEKSRFAQEDRILPVEVRWNFGICPWAGFDELAEGFGLIETRKGAKSQTWWQFPSKALIASNPEKYSDPAMAITSPDVEQVDAEGEVIPDIATDNKFWEFVFKNTELAASILATYRK